MVLSKCIFRRKFKCRQFWQQQFSTFSCNPKTSDSIYFKHRLEIGKNITIPSFKVRPLQWFWCLFEIYVLQEFFHWHLYLCISSFLCNCIWISNVMYLCVCVFADIPWSMRACIAMCGAAWCQRKPSVELGWKGSGYEERNGIIQKHHLHLPPSKDSKEKILFTGASTYGVPQKKLPFVKIRRGKYYCWNEKSTNIFLDKCRWFIFYLYVYHLDRLHIGQ